MRHFFVGMLLLLASTVASAQTAADAPASSARITTPAHPAPASSITTLQAITVTGVVPGPGLWTVRHGDHVLWILGVVPTLPAGIDWRSSEVEGAIAASQVVIQPPGVDLKLDTNWFGKLLLAPSVYFAQRNPDGKTLEDVLPPAMYARWQAARRQYYGDDDDIDRYRPFLAAGKLLKKALHAHGLRGDGEITDKVAALAKKYHVRLEKPEATLEIHEPRAAIKYFTAQDPQGVACLGLVLDAVEHELPEFRARANAWATGNVEVLRRAPESHYRVQCKSALTSAGFAKALGIADLPARIEGHWLAAVDAALIANARTFAVLPMHELLAPDGYLSALRARGYTVVAPDVEADSAPAEAPAPSASAAPPAATTH